MYNRITKIYKTTNNNFDWQIKLCNFGHRFSKYLFAILSN